MRFSFFAKLGNGYLTAYFLKKAQCHGLRFYYFWPLLQNFTVVFISAGKKKLFNDKGSNTNLLNQTKKVIINFIISKSTASKIMRKINCESVLSHNHLQFAKDTSHSLSTQESPRQMQSGYLTHKQKSQLCKKYVQNGYCPYEKKCKFAHGLHELKKNQQANSKYKTKTCGGFLQEGYCPYGNRCNFIHPSPVAAHFRLNSDDFELLMIKKSIKQQSKLMALLAK